MRQMDRVMFQAVLQAVDRSAKYLLAWHADCEQDGTAVPTDVRAIYADIRRARSDLAGRMDKDPEARKVPTEGLDVDVLVSCILYWVDELDRQLPRLKDERHDAARRRRDGLGRVAVVLARNPAKKLPVRSRIGRQESPTVRSVMCAINAKLTPTTARSGEEFGMPKAFSGGITGGLPGGSGSPVAKADAPGEWSVSTRDESVVELLEQRLKHPRLRMLHRLDVEAYERALVAKDHRLALLHLASVLDGILIDHALPRRRALGLTSNPDTWRAGELVDQLVGDQLESAQKTFVELLVRARRFAYPGLQLIAKHTVNAASVEQAVAVVVSIYDALRQRAAADQPGEADGAPAEEARDQGGEEPVVEDSGDGGVSPDEPGPEAAPTPADEVAAEEAPERYYSDPEPWSASEISGLTFHLDPAPAPVTAEGGLDGDVPAADSTGDPISDRP